jgi:GTP pyrophosphokinase
MQAVEETGTMRAVLEKLGYPDMENLAAAVVYGGISPIHVATRVKDEVMRTRPELLPQKELPAKQVSRRPKGPEEAVVIKGMADFLVRLAHCCNPVPGDPIIGYITRGRGVSVHRIDCPSLRSYTDKERFIEASWVRAVDAAYPVEITLEGQDRRGLFADVTSVIAGLGANILAASAKGQPDGIARVNATFEIHDLAELEEALSRIRQVKGITSVARVFGRIRT